MDVRVGAARLPGQWVRVPDAQGVTVFVHGSGSSHRSPRNRFVAQVLHGYRLDTLLFDLLTDDEAAARQNVFDIDLLARRLDETLSWLDDETAHDPLPIGLFGASTGAAAALRVGAHRTVSAIVSRGGRPDLAGGVALSRVTAPTLLIVGGDDTEVLRLNQEALDILRCPTRLDVVPGATHLFEEPGTLETVAHLAARWLSGAAARPGPQ
jgi:putative phosphoribosyl transferase